MASVTAGSSPETTASRTSANDAAGEARSASDCCDLIAHDPTCIVNGESTAVSNRR